MRKRSIRLILSESACRCGVRLERIERLLAEMGNPHKALRFVHAAGTNGKGSVSEMTAKVLEKAGHRTGFLFRRRTSLDFMERIQVNSRPSPHGDLTEL